MDEQVCSSTRQPRDEEPAAATEEALDWAPHGGGGGGEMPGPLPIQENQDSSVSQEREEASNAVEAFKDDCIIPSPVLKGVAAATFFGPDLSSALCILGTRYNSLMKKCQEQTSQLEALGTEYEKQKCKCLTECEPKYETLKHKYAQERDERRRLYNELIELKGNIRVFCRCRPLSSEEISKGHTSILDLDPSQDTELQVICSDSSRRKFKFDRVFSPQDNQEAVFAETLSLVRSALDGYNVCIFAYGQTGTGKTFTMEGTPENRGVNYRALEVLFRSSKERCSIIRYGFSVSMLEVYNEKIRDLLAENLDQDVKRLEIKQMADGSQDVPGLVEAQVNNTDEVWELLKSGGRNRSIGSTNANELSSRSHCLVRVAIKGEDLVNGQMSRSHLWLVDLAGSERVGKIEVEGERLKESQFINKSLSALGDVISALASKNPHIPYRNSKLTHLLQSSLGGDCKTLMFAQISPSSADLGETLCSLNFASRVRGIEYGPVRKQSDFADSFKHKQMMEKLRQEERETARLNDSLQLMHLKYASRENVFKSLQEKIREAEKACRNHQQRIRDLESQLAEEKSRHQLDGRDSSKYHKPPVAPTRQWPPLSRITNRLPPPGPPCRSSTTTLPTLADKENVMMTKNAADMSSSRPMKAQRISLAPVIRHIPVQRKRRASIALVPNETQRAFTKHQTDRSCPLSQLGVPRRNSVVAFTPVRGTATPLASACPERKARFSSIVTGNKYSSPPQMQAVWKSKIPTFASPRQRLHLLSSPASSRLKNTQMLNKLCFSVQKKVVIGSPAQRQHLFSGLSNNMSQLCRDNKMVGRLGTAQRVLCSNRRKSVI